MSELDDFVGNDEVEIEATVEETPESETTETAVIPKQETAEPEVSTETKGEDKGEPPAPSDETKGLLAAKQAEKEKRQRAEHELQQMRAELDALKNPVQKPDPYAEPEAYTNHVLTERESARLQASISSSEVLARMEYEDYDKYADFFVEQVVPANPALINQMKVAPDPAKFAYLIGKREMASYEARQRIEQAGGFEGYEKSLRAQIEAEFAAKPQKPSIPPDLSSVRSAGGDPKTDEIAEGTDGLRQLLGR